MYDEQNKNQAVADASLEDKHSTFTEQEIRKFKEFSQKKDLVPLLIDSLAPSIWENQDVKKGILT